MRFIIQQYNIYIYIIYIYIYIYIYLYIYINIRRSNPKPITNQNNQYIKTEPETRKQFSKLANHLGIKSVKESKELSFDTVVSINSGAIFKIKFINSVFRI